MDLIAKTMPRFDVQKGETYKVRDKLIDGPDLLVKDRGKVVVVIECKATKLTLAAQFTDDPIAEAEREYGEIAKGVFQIWRYFSHVRRGIITTDLVGSDTHGIVLTLDVWLMMSRDLEAYIFATAEALAQKEGEIVAEDRRKVLFCSSLAHA